MLRFHQVPVADPLFPYVFIRAPHADGSGNTTSSVGAAEKPGFRDLRICGIGLEQVVGGDLAPPNAEIRVGVGHHQDSFPLHRTARLVGAALQNSHALLRNQWPRPLIELIRSGPPGPVPLTEEFLWIRRDRKPSSIKTEFAPREEHGRRQVPDAHLLHV